MSDTQDKGRGHLGFTSGALGTLDMEADTSKDTRNETPMDTGGLTVVVMWSEH